MVIRQEMQEERKPKEARDEPVEKRSCEIVLHVRNEDERTDTYT
jgi:hypothetical protein